MMLFKEMHYIHAPLYTLQVDNGTSLIEVKDNGYGISKKDAPYMALPSYTSKIANFEDLGNACNPTYNSLISIEALIPNET